MMLRHNIPENENATSKVIKKKRIGLDSAINYTLKYAEKLKLYELLKNSPFFTEDELKSLRGSDSDEHGTNKYPRETDVQLI